MFVTSYVINVFIVCVFVYYLYIVCILSGSWQVWLTWVKFIKPQHNELTAFEHIDISLKTEPVMFLIETYICVHNEIKGLFILCLGRR